MVNLMPTPEQAFRLYRPLVEKFDQAEPILLWGADVSTAVQVVPPPGWDGGIGELYLVVLDGAVRDLGRPRWVVASSEAWKLRGVERMEDYAHGDAKRAFEAGDPEAFECVSIVGVGMTQEWQYTVPFTRQRYRVRWGEPEQSDQVFGSISDALKRVVR